MRAAHPAVRWMQGREIEGGGMTFGPTVQKLRGHKNSRGSKTTGIAPFSRPCLAGQPNLMPGDPIIPQPEAAASLPGAPRYAAVEHVCCVCGHKWHSENAKTARYVVLAIQTNHDGPYCTLCLHLEMAARYAEHRGYNGVRDAMTAWRRYNKD